MQYPNILRLIIWDELWVIYICYNIWLYNIWLYNIWLYNIWLYNIWLYNMWSYNYIYIYIFGYIWIINHGYPRILWDIQEAMDPVVSCFQHGKEMQCLLPFLALPEEKLGLWWWKITNQWNHQSSSSFISWISGTFWSSPRWKIMENHQSMDWFKGKS